MARSKKPKAAATPPKDIKTAFWPGKTIRADDAGIDYYMTQHPSWRFFQRDRERWVFDYACAQELLPFERMTWGEILAQSHNNSHSVDVTGMNKCARDRLTELQIFDDRIVSLRLQGKIRVYGILQGSALSILWYDTDHGDNDTCVYRSRKK